MALPRDVVSESPQYDGLAELREALTADDPDRRAPAYGAVMEADLEPSAVLSTDPPGQALRDAGVIPADQGRGRTTDDQLDQIVQLLQEIAANTGGAQ